ncbi:hypothetical protein P691DRAFT_530379 [Macrolepiota fuliginosa MF-IS2]|uniref:Uncharacterized protein n=1 Tax=Macrolepiota fuliginosa MF-IS2 TaxID=1400762 RepID=A0A9P6CAC9_9AGAR|nr:hypothetical protein P691DRAFT_530379 [Macrolepiota fuliginosa MF-IS2]
MEWRSSQPSSRRLRRHHHSCLSYFCMYIPSHSYICQCVGFLFTPLSLLPPGFITIPGSLPYSVFCSFSAVPMNSCKAYADKGTQTESLGCSPGLGFHSSPHVIFQNDVPCNPDVSQTSELSSALHVLDEFGAYTYSEASLDESRYISDRPVTNPRRAQKYGQLGYNKPPRIPSVDHRVASLPETSPPYRIAQIQESTVRLVSMPERLKALRHPIDQSDRYHGHSGPFNVSPAGGHSHSGCSDADHTLFGRTLQTPSPPSSPESVMIIGNEAQVPQAFLRPKSNIDDDDHGGWIPWKGSPPKPIPALHGPLSLPYARCPSGAEGTVIEGEDLTHMIWGLDTLGSQSTQTKSQSTSIHGHNIHRHASSSYLPMVTSTQDHITHGSRKRDMIDLSRPEFHAPHRVEGLQFRRSSRTSTTFEGPPLPRRDAQSKKSNHYEFVRRDLPIQLYPSFKLVQPEVDPWNTGLGINLWQGTHESDPFLHSDVTFPSIDSRGSPLVFNRHLEALDTRGQHLARSLPAYDIQGYNSHRHRQRSGILTPPDTGSPRWSPRFHQPDIASMSPDIRYEQPQESHFSEGPKYLGDHSALYTVQEQMFHSTVSDYRPGNGLAGTGEISRTPASRQISDTSLLINTTPESQNFVTQSPPKFRCAQGKLNALQGPTPPSPVSPDLRRNLSQQQPRSIPLARLIQRRLSSVVEEAETDDMLPGATGSAAGRSNRELASKMDSSTESENREGRSQRREVDAIHSPPARLSIGDAKRAYRPPSHPSRRAPANSRSTAPKVSKPTTIADQVVPPTNRFGENRENHAVSQKASIKQKRSSRKKKFMKKQDTPVVGDKQP